MVPAPPILLPVGGSAHRIPALLQGTAQAQNMLQIDILVSCELWGCTISAMPDSEIEFQPHEGSLTHQALIAFY